MTNSSSSTQAGQTGKGTATSVKSSPPVRAMDQGPESANENRTGVDRETERYLDLLAYEQQIRAQKIPGVRTVLMVLSSRGMVYDIEALRQKVLQTYPEAAVFIQTTYGKPIGAAAPKSVDLVIDFTGPGQRQGWFYSRKLRRMGRVTIGRNAGLFRAKIYDRIFDEKAKKDQLPSELLTRERWVQKEVLALAGIPLSQSADPGTDRGQTIALELPPLRKL